MGVGVREGEWWGGVVVYIDVYLTIVCVEGGGGGSGQGTYKEIKQLYNLILQQWIKITRYTKNLAQNIITLS